MTDQGETSTLAAIETPSGKDAAYENFPVGSWLLPAAPWRRESDPRPLLLLTSGAAARCC